MEVENQGNISNLTRANLLFRVLRRRLNENRSTSISNTGNLINLISNSGSESRSSSDGENNDTERNNIRELMNPGTSSNNQRFGTTLIGIRSLFERIFQGQINFNRIISNENLTLSNTSLNIGQSSSIYSPVNSTNNINNNDGVSDLQQQNEFKELLKMLTNCDSEYSDFRTYPLKIDWKEIEKGRSYAHEAMEAFGFLGASIYTSLNRLNNFAISYKKMPKEIIEIYSDLIKDYSNYKQYNKIKQYIEELPSLDDLEIILINSFLSFKEYLLLIVLLHILLHYYSKVDFQINSQKKTLELIEFFIANYLGDLGFLSIIKSLLSNTSFKKHYKDLSLDLEPLLDLRALKKKIGYLTILTIGSGGFQKDQFVL